MTKASDNDFPSILLTEQGSAPTSPAASHQRLYIRTSDHTLVTVNSSGTVSSVGGGGGGAGSLVFLEAHTASTSATLDFTSFISGTYDDYLFEIVNLLPATNGVSLYMRMGTGGGPTYDSAGNYASTDYRWVPGGAAQSGASSGATQIVLTNYSATDTVSSTANNGGVNSVVRLGDPGSAVYKNVTAQSSFVNTGSVIEGAVIHGMYLSTTAVTAVRFLFSSGNIASGVIRCYGFTKS